MKKFLKLILICLTVICTALAFAACDDGSGTSSTAPGPKYRTQNDEKILTRYVPEEGVTTFTVADDVDKIQANAFKDNATITEIVVPANVKEIGAGAFAGMRALKKITLPFIGGTADAVNAAKTFAFIFGTASYEGGVSVTQNYGSSSATYYLPETLTEIVVNADLKDEENAPVDYKLPAYAFNSLGKIAKITLSGNVTEIGAHAFEGCYSLSSFSVPATVKKIGDSAFVGCNRIAGVASTAENAVLKFAAGTALEEIGERAFEGTRLTEVTVPEGVKKIGKYAFASGVTNLEIGSESKLEKITLPFTLEKIDDYTFFKCVNLKEVRYKEGLKRIGIGAFSYCAALKIVTCGDETVPAEGGSIKIAASVEKIYAGAFEFIGDGECEYEITFSSNSTVKAEGWDKDLKTKAN